MGFEPTIRYNRIPDFESGAFDLSAILPFIIIDDDDESYRTDPFLSNDIVIKKDPSLGVLFD